MKQIIMLALTIFLTSSCKDAIICAQINSAKIKPLVLKDISFQFDRCRIRCFDINTWATFPSLNACEEFKDDLETPEKENEEPYRDYEIKYCDGLSGFDVKDMAKVVRPKIKELAQIKEDNCK